MGRVINEKQSGLQAGMVEKGLEFYKKETIGYYDLSIRFGKCKTTIELLKELYRTYHKMFPRILIAYPDNKLKETWESEMKRWNYNDLNVDLVNFSSLKNYIDSDFDHFIVDEFHAVSDNELDLCWQIVKNSGKTTCLSGTVDKECKKRWGIKEIAKYTTQQGIDDNILADYKVTVHVVELDNKVKFKDKNGKEKTEKQKYGGYTFVIERLKREGKDTMFLSLARNRISLNSLGKRQYVQNLLRSMGDKRFIVFTGLTEAADSLGIPSYHSKSKKSCTSFEDFQSGKISKLALGQMGKVGVSYYKLDGTILTNFTYNAKDTTQILQRAILLDYGDKVADLHIVVINEEPELKKVRETLSMLSQDKISWTKTT